jgi:hypothetical protein
MMINRRLPGAKWSWVKCPSWTWKYLALNDGNMDKLKVLDLSLFRGYFLYSYNLILKNCVCLQVIWKYCDDYRYFKQLLLQVSNHLHSSDQFSLLLLLLTMPLRSFTALGWAALHCFTALNWELKIWIDNPLTSFGFRSASMHCTELKTHWMFQLLANFEFRSTSLHCNELKSDWRTNYQTDSLLNTFVGMSPVAKVLESWRATSVLL